jgi:hypothetical protein
MAQQPEVGPWPPLNNASKLAYLEILLLIKEWEMVVFTETLG